MTSSRSTRRRFLQQSALLGASAPLLAGASSQPSRPTPPNDKVRFASIGVGGKGESDTNDAGHQGDLVAICDTDEKVLDKMGERYPNARKFFDFRTMLGEMGDKIDAVTVSTPDHTHAVAAAMAMRMGKHAFVQKPLTWSIEEARLLRSLATEKHLCTQMGNQGTAADGFREGVELLRSGYLGAIKEIHVWTNRPIWPQGIPKPTAISGIPNSVHWYEWLGPAQDRPYDKAYQPFSWRGWLDFGTGALGDMACHTINVAAMGLSLFDPETVEVVETSGIVDRQSYPSWSIIKTHFGARESRQALDLTWYDGGDRLPKEKLAAIKARLGRFEMPKSGLLIIGERGSFFSRSDYGAEYHLIGIEKPTQAIEKTLPRSPGHFHEWVDAIKSGEPTKALSNFEYAGRLTETVLLGVVALKAGGTIEWDPAAMKVKNNPDANQYLTRDYRPGFSIH